MLTRNELEETLMRKDVVEYISNMEKSEIDDKFGEKIARMKGFEQKNIHHCYDLLGHTLHTVENVDKPKLKVAALFHDVGKPDVSSFNEKTRQQVFYGHAEKSKEISKELLLEFGYSNEEIAQMGFYIKHHDDFISYKYSIPEYMKNHEFIREINAQTVAEKMIENKYDFEKMGLDKDQIRYVCYYFARGEEPVFSTPNGTLDIKVDIDSVKEMMSKEEYLQEYIPSKEDYNELIELCRADAKAQTEFYQERGKVLCSRRDKLKNMDCVSKGIDEAYKIMEDVGLDIEMSSKLVNIIEENKNLEIMNIEAEELESQYRDEVKSKRKGDIEKTNE